MVRLPIAQRKLFIHPAHQTIGVVGGTVFRPYCKPDDLWNEEPIIAQRRVVAVADRRDADAWAAMCFFERFLIAKPGMTYCRIELDAIEANREEPLGADAIVAFGRGLCIARNWTDVEAASICETPAITVDQNLTAGEMEITPQGSHPVLESVGPFRSRLVATTHVQPPCDATILLQGRMAGGILPVAWLERHGCAEVFHSCLGTIQDWREDDFLRLVLNTVEWIGR